MARPRVPTVRTNGELARILRYGVRADGRAAIPLMEYQPPVEHATGSTIQNKG
jgi:hypothetical protein